MTIEYRAEVIGSMLRLGYLKDARKRWEAGNLGTLAFKRVEDRAAKKAGCVAGEVAIGQGHR